jgi:hypothetical protein
VEKYGGHRQATDDNIIWRMRVACWITKATDTDSDISYDLRLTYGRGIQPDKFKNCTVGGQKYKSNAKIK